MIILYPFYTPGSEPECLNPNPFILKVVDGCAGRRFFPLPGVSPGMARAVHALQAGTIEMRVRNQGLGLQGCEGARNPKS